MAAVPDLRVEVLRVGEGPPDTAWLDRASRAPTGPTGRLDGPRRARDVPAVSIYRVTGGLIAEEAEYIDPAVMMTPPE